MRVFLDTNVIVGAVAARGLCADVMREVLARHELVISGALLGEVGTVLHEKIGVPAAAVSDLISLLREGAVLGAPSAAPELPVHDKMDKALVSAAINGKADLFVTGDGELLRLHGTGDMAIVSPREFWERAKAGLQSNEPR